MSSNPPKTASVLVPQSKDNPDDVKVQEIPLPPPELWGELDNSASAGKKPADAPKPPAAREIAELAFSDPKKIVTVVSLVFPFDHPELGRVDTITVRRLTVGEVGNLLDQRPADAPDMFDIYAIMTGVPAPVLRGLISDDGEAVTEVCYDFLPRAFRPRPAPGAASSST